jgi:hypothetical protein
MRKHNEDENTTDHDNARKAASVIRTVAPYVPLLNTVGPMTAGLLDVARTLGTESTSRAAER